MELLWNSCGISVEFIICLWNIVELLLITCGISVGKLWNSCGIVVEHGTEFLLMAYRENAYHQQKNSKNHKITP